MTTMDTILIVNAGSSSVKFQVFAVDGDGRLRRRIKGQVDGIGSRPHLRATGSSGEKLAERVYPIESVGDVPAALQVAADWLRDEQRNLHSHRPDDECILAGEQPHQQGVVQMMSGYEAA